MTAHPLLTRRDALLRCSTGFGMLALSGLLAEDGLARTSQSTLPKPHFSRKAKNVIFCYMSGGVSHLDSFDPKPRLNREHGQPMPMKIERTMFNDNGKIFGSPFQFKQHGESGLWVSDMFPQIATCADDLAVIRSMTSTVSEHAQANCFFHTGFPFLGHPSAGAWVSYGLGTENRNMPGFVVLQSGGAVVPHGGVRMFGNGFLPAQHQASLIQAGNPEAVRNLIPKESLVSQRTRMDFVNRLDQQYSQSLGRNAPVDAAIKNFETAYRMQAEVPELCDLKDEPEIIRRRYGMDSSEPTKAAYAAQCLLARRLVERGVRFVELSCITKNIGAGGAANPWDQHSDLERGHRAMAFQVDQPIAALIKDLKARGLLDDTLIVWAGEFGRTPFSQGSNGRDHNPFGFSVWLAGGGIRGGTTYGATDEYGYHVIENKATVYDLWATVLHVLGIDHRDLTYRSGGRDYRLTDVHGNVIHPILS